MSLDSYADRTGKGVPTVHFVNRFINTVFVLLSDDTIVFDVVDCLQPVETHDDIPKLEFQRLPAEEEVNTGKNGKMECLIPDHLVVEESC